MSNNQPKFIKDLGMRLPKPTSKKKQLYWLVECPVCFSEYEAQAAYIKRKLSIKCRNCADVGRTASHGLSGHKLYFVWYNMKSRCHNIKNKQYVNYGGRGIKVCEEWKDNLKLFYDWAIKNGWKEDLDIDRKNNDFGYSPDNCRFTTRAINMRNTRKIKTTNKSGYRGVSWWKNNNKWIAQISVNNIIVYLGSFEKKLDAAKAYDAYVIKNNLEHTRNFT